MPGVFSDTALWQLCPCKVSAGRRPVDLVEGLDAGHLGCFEKSVPIHILFTEKLVYETLNRYMGCDKQHGISFKNN